MALQREDMVKLARCAVGGNNRPADECSDSLRACPAAVTNPDSFDPPEWVLEAMTSAYARGLYEGSKRGPGSYPGVG